MKKKHCSVATVAKYGNFFYLNLDEDNPSRFGNTVGKKTLRSDLTKTYPDWLPAPLKEEAQFIIIKLSRMFNLDQIFNFITWREVSSPLISEQVPDGAKDKIDALIYIQRLIELGKEKGIKAYLGEGSEKVYRGIVERDAQSKRGKKKAGGLGPVKYALGIICREIGSKSYPDFIDAINPVKEKDEPVDNDLILDLYERLSNPITIHHFELSKEKLYFKHRDGREDNKTIKYIRNILYQIKI